jgi:ligand-binding sensor domain-containing protein
MDPVSKWRWWRIGACVVTAAVLLSAAVIWQTSRALKVSKQELRAEREIPFTLRPFLPVLNTNFEIIRAPELFVQTTQFQGSLYVAGPANLSQFDSRGNLLREFAAGRDLPGSPLVSMAVGELTGATQPELILATADQGILVFDGKKFRQIYPANANVREVTVILPVASGHLLIGTKKRGVLVYDGKSIQELHPTLSHFYVRALAGSEVDLWVGTLDQGVKHWHAGTTETFSEEQGLPDRQVQAIALAGEKAYVGTPVGVAEFDRGRFSRTLAKGVLVTSLYVRGDELWIGSEDQGVVRLPLAPGHRRSVSASGHGMALDEVMQIVGTQDGVLVLARDGIFEMKAGGLGWQQVLKPRSGVLTDRNISALARDNKGELWVGYFDRGLDILPNGPLSTVHFENEHVFCVNRIWPDAKGGTVEVATANGLVRFGPSGKPEQILGKADGLIAEHVTDVVPYHDGLAIATPAGITFLDANGATSIYGFQGLVNNHVFALGVLGDDLMVGTLGGLSTIQKGLVKANFTAGNSGLRQNWITAVAHVGDEWMIGTYGSGVMGFDSSGKFHPYPIASARVEINPNAMLVTKDHVFAGTLGDGLYLYDRQKQRWSILTEGLPSTNVTALAEGEGYIYVGTDNGLVRIEESKIQP